MTKSPTLLLSKISSILKTLDDQGVNTKELLLSEGIDPLMLDSPDSRISLEMEHSILSKAAHLTEDRDLGLHIGEVFPGLPSILCYLIMSCRDLGMAIEKLCKYQRITDDTKQLDVIFEKKSVSIRISYESEFYDCDKQLISYQLCGLYSCLKFLTGKALPLNEVRLRCRLPDDISEYQRIFSCPLNFESDENAIVMDRSLLITELLQPNKDLLLMFEQRAEKVLQNYDEAKPYTKQLVRLILQEIEESVPTIQAIAHKMGVGVRNLQLKLRMEETTYSKQLNDIRIGLAMEYLNDEQSAISEISYLLGFSDPSVFHTFFKKHTGETPVNYRKKLHS